MNTFFVDFHQNVQLLPTLDFRKRFLRTFAKPKQNRIMATKYQKTSIKITDLMQQSIIKKHLFCLLKT
jgi:hypothetical protein